MWQQSFLTCLDLSALLQKLLHDTKLPRNCSLPHQLRHFYTDIHFYTFTHIFNFALWHFYTLTQLFQQLGFLLQTCSFGSKQKLIVLFLQRPFANCIDFALRPKLCYCRTCLWVSFSLLLTQFYLKQALACSDCVGRVSLWATVGGAGWVDI